VGLLEVERGLKEILEVLRRHPEWSLVMAGFGGDQEHLLKLAEELPNVKYLGRIPYERALRLSAAADVLFATYHPGIPNHRLASPNKVFEAMMLGKPVVVARGTNMDRVVEETNCGLVVEYGQTDALEASLKRLADDSALRQRLGINARQTYVDRYSWQIMKERLLALYQEMCSPSHA
jgi:glycosyltransferase involved in cell wall biosynthesis